MKRHLILLTFLLLVGGWRAQGQQNITASSTACATSGSCVIQNLNPNGTATAFITIDTATGSFSGTLQFEILGDGTEGHKTSVACAAPGTPTTTVTSATSGGQWKCDVAGAQAIQVRCSAYSSGTAAVQIQASNAISASILAGGGGGGSGTVTSVTFTGDGTVLSATPSSAVTTSGTLTAALANQTANTVLGALTATTPSDLPLPSCSATTSALIWTSGTGFGCHTITPGAGTVTSVTFTGDGIIDSSTPSTAVTTSGTVAATPLTQTANTVLAGPASGSAANPAFRALVSLDIPNNGANTTGTAANVTGIVAAANGGTGVANTATQTLGTSNRNYAALGTGIEKNTTTTGAVSVAAASDIYGLFTSCTGSSGLFLKDGGTCAAPGGSGTVTVVGAGNLTSTNIVTGGGTQTIQTPSSAATVDSSGNIVGNTLTSSGNITSGASSVISATSGTLGIQATGAITTTSSAGGVSLVGGGTGSNISLTSGSGTATTLIKNGGAAGVTLTVRQPASPTGDAFETQTSGSAVQSSIGPSGIVQSGGTQTVSGANYTNATTTPSTIFSWTLPPTGAAKNYAYTCHIIWESTGTALTNLILGVNISAAPTQITSGGYITYALAGTQNTGYISNATTGNQTVITGTLAGVTATPYEAELSGTIEASPTAGATFTVTGTETAAVTQTVSVMRGSWCALQ
jgi:hypothetical protein